MFHRVENLQKDVAALDKKYRSTRLFFRVQRFRGVLMMAFWTRGEF